MAQWDKQPRLHTVRFQWEEEPHSREVLLDNGSVAIGSPVSTVAGLEVEGQIKAVESSILRVLIGGRPFQG